MGIFLDTSFYYALIRRDDKNHQRADELLEEIGTNRYGAVYTSDYVLDESLTLISIRTHGRVDIIRRMGKLFLGDERIAHLFAISSSWLHEIFEFQMKNTEPHQEYSFTDCSSIICCKKHHISTIISFDGHFEGHLIQIQ